MKAQIYSSIDAHDLLHQLRNTAADMPEVYSEAEVPWHGASTSVGDLHLTQKLSGKAVSATISQLDQGSLIAALDNETDLALVAAKRRLADLLSPVVTRYNTSKKPGLAPDDKAIIVFEDDVTKV